MDGRFPTAYYKVDNQSLASIVRLLSVELFILGVQANKLHFCNLELILNKTGYSHIMENKKNFFSFFNMGTGYKKICPPRFSQFSPEPAKIFSEKDKVFLEASICDVLMVNHCWGLTLPKVMGKIQKALSKIS